MSDTCNIAQVRQKNYYNQKPKSLRRECISSVVNIFEQVIVAVAGMIQSAKEGDRR